MLKMKKSILTLLLVGWASLVLAQHNPYISKVYEYCPAPGQFVNLLPEYEEGDDANDMRLKAEDCLANHEQVMISLGGWGGYVVFGFDHMVPNFKDEYDLKILGNSFFAASNPNPDAPRGGSAEPGVVMVSYDANHNGRPDDPWYELAGSEYHNPSTIHNYTLTYHRTPSSHVATPDKSYPYLTDTTYIRWTESYNGVTGATGYLAHNSYNTQPYYPLWIDSDSLTFSGTRLPDNGVDESGNRQYYVLYCFDWGYADNQPNHVEGEHSSEFKLDWAVDGEGNSVNLPGINFVKIYTGVNQQNGWLGEASTEVMDAWDLHMIDADGNEITGIVTTETKLEDSQSSNLQPQTLYDLSGRKINSQLSIINSQLPKGLYILRSSDGKTRLIKY